ncbi:MAG: Rid family detoxifying hydrolase [Steroidobacteraceae bacterium]
MNREVIQTSAAPKPIGPYSQAIRVGNLVFISGQIAFDPVAMKLVNDDVESEVRQVFENLQAVARAAGGSLAQACKLNVYLTDMGYLPKVNEAIPKYCAEPYAARTSIGVAALPRGARVEVEAVLQLG